MVVAAVRESLVETLSVVASAANSRSRGQPFYEEIIAFLTTLTAEADSAE